MQDPSTTTHSPGYEYQVRKMAGDMNFVGIFYIIGGALYCLTIIGAIIGIPVIIMALRLREAAELFKLHLNSNDIYHLEQAFEKQSKFFYIMKVLIIIGLVLFVLYIIGMIVFFGSVMSGFEDSMMQNSNWN